MLIAMLGHIVSIVSRPSERAARHTQIAGEPHVKCGEPRALHTCLHDRTVVRLDETATKFVGDSAQFVLQMRPPACIRPCGSGGTVLICASHMIQGDHVFIQP
jgi:hypothetical protein